MASPVTAPPAKFQAGMVVRVDGYVTGTWFRARILRAEYSAFFECWVYDIVVTQSRSNLYPRGMEEHALFESMIRER